MSSSQSGWPGSARLWAICRRVCSLTSEPVRLHMSRQLPHQETGETFTFYFKAVGEDESKVFLAQAALRNLFSDPQQGVTSLGFEFTAEGRLNRDKKLVWTPLADNTLPGLGPFIFKWNLLDFYRDKRVE